MKVFLERTVVRELTVGGKAVGFQEARKEWMIRIPGAEAEAMRVER